MSTHTRRFLVALACCAALYACAIAGTELDGLSYQGASTPPASPFADFGEGSIFTFTAGTTNNLVRTPDANDTCDNANDFRRNGTLGSVTPKAANPAPP